MPVSEAQKKATKKYRDQHKDRYVCQLYVRHAKAIIDPDPVKNATMYDHVQKAVAAGEFDHKKALLELREMIDNKLKEL
ncbi:MAG: hypothetical protein ACI31L_08555 [Limosilactobacillus sp.]|uniref:Uncharacterized protein n=1 Tax=Limosilactobacillus allomucosae TaxID=3142938 RepID=A0ABV0I4H9_9LACO